MCAGVSGKRGVVGMGLDETKERGKGEGYKKM